MWQLALLCAALGAETQQGVNPVEKVTALLQKLQAEIEEEGKSEAAAYDKYACFCKEQADNKQYAIEKFIATENSLKAKIEDKTARKAQLDQEIADHKVEIEELEATQEEANGVVLRSTSRTPAAPPSLRRPSTRWSGRSRPCRRRRARCRTRRRATPA